MKILALSCSPRRHGNTEILLGETLAGAKEAGAETELVSLAGKEIKGCDGCRTCDKNGGKCHIEDDAQEIFAKMLEADGIVFGTPVYFWSMSAQAKALLDRSISLRSPTIRLANKVAGVITVAGRMGGMNTAMVFYSYFIRCHMLIADDVCALASKKGAVRNDRFSMIASREMGKQMVALGKTGFKYPEGYDTPPHIRIQRKYGISASPFDDAMLA